MACRVGRTRCRSASSLSAGALNARPYLAAADGRRSTPGRSARVPPHRRTKDAYRSRIPSVRCNHACPGMVPGLPGLCAPGSSGSAAYLLRSAVALWLSNVLVFATWYWRLDAGGPHKRDQTPSHIEGAFLFPQMLNSHYASKHPCRPGFVTISSSHLTQAPLSRRQTLPL